NALSFYIYVTPFLNPSPRERDFVGSKTLLKWCFALAKLESFISSLCKYRMTGINEPRFLVKPE
ncbi:MAG: hypothetical protein VZR28_08415, partial [Candidatus Cryptobacteroides sp.]|nr:hypothetical protein [Candidatus Cryptobacteroides sp.]